MEDFKKYFPETDFQSLKINVTVQFVNKYSTSCSVESFLSIYLVVLIFFFCYEISFPFLSSRHFLTRLFLLNIWINRFSLFHKNHNWYYANKIVINNDVCVLLNTHTSKILWNAIDLTICSIVNVSNIDNKNIFFIIVVLWAPVSF